MQEFWGDETEGIELFVTGKVFGIKCKEKRKKVYHGNTVVYP